MREQCIVLEHHGRRTCGRRQHGNIVSVDQNRARTDLLMSGDHPQQRCLATARRSQKTAIERVDDLEIDLPHSDRLPVHFLQASKFEIKDGGGGRFSHGRSIQVQFSESSQA